MIDYRYLLEQTSAYKTLRADKQKGNLSHAYLIIIPDEQKLREYLKVFAKLMLCSGEEICESCRNCKLIESDCHSDVMYFPEKEGAVVTADVNKLVEESFYKPIEGEKKIFIISSAQTMNAQSQNKLLKTLEEPPKNVHIVLGATNEHALLPTIKSRVRRLEISSFSKDRLKKALEKECDDYERLESAVDFSDGTVGSVLSLYNDEKLQETKDFVLDLIANMSSSKEVLKYSTQISEKKIETEMFLSVLELTFRDLLLYYNESENLIVNKKILVSGALEVGYNRGSTLHAIEKIGEARVRLNFNTNQTMLIEWLLFQILEGKHKWQKL
ncbi:MAG: hypothetical protein IJW43_06795 [Clostridia bacterium]|nr:hypothetical protein [Clostridia bacterium]MBQ7340541.1 hypothetical protein [Clostridia bacterium]